MRSGDLDLEYLLLSLAPPPLEYRLTGLREYRLEREREFDLRLRLSLLDLELDRDLEDVLDLEEEDDEEDDETLRREASLRPEEVPEACECGALLLPVPAGVWVA